MPLISIVTVCYNAQQFIEKTIQSIINQTFKDLEYIIIDGGSKDKTLKIIKKYESKISKIISEPDNGLYDAMNKGIKKANGKYILFINAGDAFHSPTTLQEVFNKCQQGDVIYGDTLITDYNWAIKGKRRLRPPKKLKFKDFSKGMLVSHQAFIAKKELAELYDTNYKYSADFDWTIKILKKAKTICNASVPIAHFMEGGQTSKTIIPGLKERFIIMKKHYGLSKTIFMHFFILFRFIFHQFSKK